MNGDERGEGLSGAAELAADARFAADMGRARLRKVAGVWGETLRVMVEEELAEEDASAGGDGGG